MTTIFEWQQQNQWTRNRDPAVLIKSEEMTDKHLNSKSPVDMFRPCNRLCDKVNETLMLWYAEPTSLGYLQTLYGVPLKEFQPGSTRRYWFDFYTVLLHARTQSTGLVMAAYCLSGEYAQGGGHTESSYIVPRLWFSDEADSVTFKMWLDALPK